MKKKHDISIAARKKIFQTLSEFFDRQCPDVVAVFVFGSFASSGGFADIDIGLFLDAIPNRPLDYELRLETCLEDLLRLPVDVRVLDGAPVAFCQSVLRTGRLVLNRNSDRLADFQCRVLKQYFDFLPFRQRYLSEALHASV